MRSIVYAFIYGLALTACGSASDTKEATPAAAAEEWDDTAMQALVGAKCATSGCHDGTQSPNISGYTEAQMKANTTARTRVQASTMPPANASPLSAAERTTFLNFYTN